MNARALFALAAAAAIGSCARGPVIVHLTGRTMGTTFSVKVEANDDASTRTRIADAIDDVLEEFDARFSTWRDDSTISRFNAHRSTDAFDVGTGFTDLVSLALRVAHHSGGGYDPTVLPLLRAYGFDGPDRREPTDAEIEAALTHVGYERLEVLDGGRLRKSDPDLELDLSSIAKGAGVDAVAAALGALGYPNLMVEIGGEVVCRGTKSDGEPWRIGIEKPDDGGRRLVQEIVELVDGALATSGSYRNAFESGGHRVHHVFDARTGRNAVHSVVSASVRAPTCALADAIATALLIVGVEDGARLVGAFAAEGVSASCLAAQADGTVRVTTF